VAVAELGLESSDSALLPERREARLTVRVLSENSSRLTPKPSLRFRAETAKSARVFEMSRVLVGVSRDSTAAVNRMVAGSSPARGVVKTRGCIPQDAAPWFFMGPKWACSRSRIAIAGGPAETKVGVGTSGPRSTTAIGGLGYTLLELTRWAMTAVPTHLTLRSPLHRDRTASVTATGAGIHIGRRVSRRALPRLPTRDRVIATGA